MKTSTASAENKIQKGAKTALAGKCGKASNFKQTRICALSFKSTATKYHT